MFYGEVYKLTNCYSVFIVIFTDLIMKPSTLLGAIVGLATMAIATPVPAPVPAPENATLETRDGNWAYCQFDYLGDDVSMYLKAGGPFLSPDNGGQNVAPGYGVGLRVKLNKFSGANLCVDYGFGTEGSRGIAVNLGEVF